MIVDDLSACERYAGLRGRFDLAFAYLRRLVADGDEARVRFLSAVGLYPDGAVRELASGPGPDDEQAVLHERRWGASI